MHKSQCKKNKKYEKQGTIIPPEVNDSKSNDPNDSEVD
jgi:hypothetical protein